MIRTIVVGSLIALVAGVAFGQSTANPPAFEVASIKRVAPPQPGQPIRVMMGNDPGRINLTSVTLRILIMRAYEVKDYQITGPDWLNSERFDVIATKPPNTPAEQIPLMLQTLLAERFKLALHRETKKLPEYALVGGKNGPKLQKSKEEDSEPAGVAGGGTGGGAGEQRAFVGRKGTMRMGLGRVTANGMSISDLANLLSSQLGRPVVDLTGLTGHYDFNLEWTPDQAQRMTSPLGGGLSSDRPAPSTPQTADGPSIFIAVQEQLGLKLQSQKGPVQTLVIDHVEKPTDN